MASGYQPFQDAPISPLPEGVTIKHILDAAGQGSYDFSRLDTRPTRSMVLGRIFALLAFLFGVAASAIFVYRVWSGGVPITSDEFSALFQINSYAYVAAAAGLLAFRMSSKPPVGLDVQPSGLTFHLSSGRVKDLAWSQLAGQTGLFDETEDPDRPPRNDLRLQLYTLPRYQAALALIFLPPTVPRTYLTREAFEAVLEGATKAGLTVTRYGDRYVLDQLNPMMFPPRF